MSFSSEAGVKIVMQTAAVFFEDLGRAASKAGSTLRGALEIGETPKFEALPPAEAQAEGGDSGKGKKGKKKKKDGEKRAPTEYNLFIKANTTRVREANPGIKQTEIMTMLGAEWKKKKQEAAAKREADKAAGGADDTDDEGDVAGTQQTAEVGMEYGAKHTPSTQKKKRHAEEGEGTGKKKKKKHKVDKEKKKKHHSSSSD
jgi:hypothetical protein